MAVTRVHIERLILEGIDVPGPARSGFAEALRTAIEEHVRATPLSGLRPGAFERVKAAPVTVDAPPRMGADIGRAVVDSIRSAPEGRRRR